MVSSGTLYCINIIILGWCALLLNPDPPTVLFYCLISCEYILVWEVIRAMYMTYPRPLWWVQQLFSEIIWLYQALDCFLELQKEISYLNIHFIIHTPINNTTHHGRILNMYLDRDCEKTLDQRFLSSVTYYF